MVTESYERWPNSLGAVVLSNHHWQGLQMTVTWRSIRQVLSGMRLAPWILCVLAFATAGCGCSDIPANVEAEFVQQGTVLQVGDTATIRARVLNRRPAMHSLRVTGRLWESSPA